MVGLDLGTTLIFTGLYNVASGALFGIPMPVQPMKAIAAVALAQEGINLAEVLAAGIFVSAVTLLLGVTRLITLFNRLHSLVLGVQLRTHAKGRIGFLHGTLPAACMLHACRQAAICGVFHAMAQGGSGRGGKGPAAGGGPPAGTEGDTQRILLCLAGRNHLLAAAR